MFYLNIIPSLSPSAPDCRILSKGWLETKWFWSLASRHIMLRARWPSRHIGALPSHGLAMTYGPRSPTWKFLKSSYYTVNVDDCNRRRSAYVGCKRLDVSRRRLDSSLRRLDISRRRLDISRRRRFYICEREHEVRSAFYTLHSNSTCHAELNMSCIIWKTNHTARYREW